MSAAILLALFVLPLGSIALDLRRDELDLPPLGLARHLRVQEAEFDRLTAPLPEWRESLLPVDWHETWPQRQTPSDLPGRNETAALAAYPLQSRVADPVLAATAEVCEGRHHVGVAPGTDLQRARWNTPSGQFWAAIDAGWTEDERATLSREWWCQSCLDDHKDCEGLCACPCTLAEVAA